jgi:hypothetical protein
MGFFDGLFGGSSPSSTTSSSSTTNTYVDPGGHYYPLEQSVLSTAQGLLNRPYQDYATSQRIAGFTPDQQSAMQGIRDAQGNWQPAFNVGQGNYNAASGAAGGVGTSGMPAFGQALSGPSGSQAGAGYLGQAAQSWTDPGVAQQWMNPYTSQVVQNTVDAANRAFNAPGGAMQNLTDAFTGGDAGQFGRNRMGDVANNLAYNFGQGLSNTVGQLNQQGYTQGMTAFGNQQQLLGQLGSTAGNLALGDINAYGNLGTGLVNQANAGVNANLAAGAGQTAFGNATQAANYKDLASLMSSGQMQQQLNQQGADFDYQKFLTQQNWDATNAALAQSLAQGWQLPTQTSSQSTSTATQNPGSGSIFGNILGGLTSIAGLGTGGGSTVGGDFFNWLGGQARGGSIQPRRAFAAGGYAPVVTALRHSAQQRQPAQMQRLQAFQQQQQGGPQAGGLPPGAMPQGMPAGGPPEPQPPPMGGPRPAFARGGSTGGPHVDEAQDRAMMRRAVWAHERAMHDATTRELTPLKRFAFGGPTGYADGGDVMNDLLLDDMGYDGQFLRALHPDERGFARRAFDAASDAVTGLPAAFGRAWDRGRAASWPEAYRNMAEGVYDASPVAAYQQMVDATRRLRDRAFGTADSDALDVGLDLADLGLGGLGLMPAGGSSGVVRRAFGRMR